MNMGNKQKFNLNKFFVVVVGIFTISGVLLGYYYYHNTRKTDCYLAISRLEQDIENNQYPSIIVEQLMHYRHGFIELPVLQTTLKKVESKFKGSWRSSLTMYCEPHYLKVFDKGFDTIHGIRKKVNKGKKPQSYNEIKKSFDPLIDKTLKSNCCRVTK